MPIMFANSAAEARGQAPPVRPFQDGVTEISDPAFHLPVTSDAPAAGYDPFPAQGTPRPSVMAQAWTLRPFDKMMADNLTGQHGEIVRVSGTPVGRQESVGTTRAVFRPIPQPWDNGYYGG